MLATSVHGPVVTELPLGLWQPTIFVKIAGLSLYLKYLERTKLGLFSPKELEGTI